jgi:hypothetical protein
MYLQTGTENTRLKCLKKAHKSKKSQALSAAKELALPAQGKLREESPHLKAQSVRKNAEILRFALLKITPCLSFPRKRESSSMWTDVDPRLRGGDNTGDFHLLGWAAGP